MIKQGIIILMIVLLVVPGTSRSGSSPVADDEEPLKCANLTYAGTKSSVCFSDEFLSTIRRETNCNPESKFTPVRLAEDDMFKFPFAIMTGEGSFRLMDQERRILKSYLMRGGFLLASAGCSSQEWDRSFRQEVRLIFPEKKLTQMKMSHPLFHTVYDIGAITLKKGGTTQLEGLEIDGKIVLIYSPEGLNDTATAGEKGKTGSKGSKCCCCGGNEIKNSREINVNIFTYALTH